MGDIWVCGLELVAVSPCHIYFRTVVHLFVPAELTGNSGVPTEEIAVDGPPV